MNPSPSGTGFQYQRITGRATPLRSVADDRKNAEAELIDFTIALPEKTSDFYRHYAAYLTVLSELTDERLPPEGRWSRKSLAESILVEQAESIQHEIGEMLKALGPLPDPKDKSALKRYAAMAYAWLAQRKKK